MRSPLWLLVLCALSAMLASAAAMDPAALLDREVPPPPRRHAAPLQQIQFAAAAAAAEPAELAHDHSLLAVAATAQASASASLAARVASETALAVDDSLIHSASVEDTVTAAGQLDAMERSLLERSIAIPNTAIPADKAKPVEYTYPPTRDSLALGLGPRGYPWPEKLQNALTTVENAAKERIGQIKRQNTWSSAAQKLVEELGGKRHKVLQHVNQLTTEIKDLLKKKKQLQNKKLQDALVERLEVTHNNLRKIRRQSHNVRKNQAAMLHQKEQLAHALEGIKRSLAVLKGMKRERQFPSKGMAERMKDQLAKFDPDLSNEKEADEVRALQFPDAVLAQIDQAVREQRRAEAQAELQAEMDAQPQEDF